MLTEFKLISLLFRRYIPAIINLFSTGTHFYLKFWVWLNGFIDIRKGLWHGGIKVYSGQKINGQSLYCFNLHMSFWNNTQNKYDDNWSLEVDKIVTIIILPFLFTASLFQSTSSSYLANHNNTRTLYKNTSTYVKRVEHTSTFYARRGSWPRAI